MKPSLLATAFKCKLVFLFVFLLQIAGFCSPEGGSKFVFQFFSVLILVAVLVALGLAIFFINSYLQKMKYQNSQNQRQEK